MGTRLTASITYALQTSKNKVHNNKYCYCGRGCWCLLILGSLFLSASMRITHPCSPFIRKGHGTGQCRAQQQWSCHFWAEAFACWSKSVLHSHLHTEGKVAGEWRLCPPASPSHSLKAAALEANQTRSGCYTSVGNQLWLCRPLKFWLCLFPKHSRTQSAYWHLRTWNF